MDSVFVQVLIGFLSAALVIGFSVVIVNIKPICQWFINLFATKKLYIRTVYLVSVDDFPVHLFEELPDVWGYFVVKKGTKEIVRYTDIYDLTFSEYSDLIPKSWNKNKRRGKML